jgi:hypothetical protein
LLYVHPPTPYLHLIPFITDVNPPRKDLFHPPVL